jgi:predicted alpha/beta-fold hydrolase
MAITYVLASMLVGTDTLSLHSIGLIHRSAPQLQRIRTERGPLPIPIDAQTHHKTTTAAREMVDSFQASSFTPERGWLGLGHNPHYQTIIGSGALQANLMGTYPRSFNTTRERLQTPDGDFFDVDYTTNLMQPHDLIEASTAVKGIAIMLHGLGSSSHSPMTTKMATAFLSKGYACALVSFRGCSGEDNATPGAYHLGFYADLDQTVRLLHARYPDTPLYLSG